MDDSRDGPLSLPPPPIPQERMQRKSKKKTKMNGKEEDTEKSAAKGKGEEELIGEEPSVSVPDRMSFSELFQKHMERVGEEKNEREKGGEKGGEKGDAAGIGAWEEVEKELEMLQSLRGERVGEEKPRQSQQASGIDRSVRRISIRLDTPSASRGQKPLSSSRRKASRLRPSGSPSLSPLRSSKSSVPPTSSSSKRASHTQPKGSPNAKESPVPDVLPSSSMTHTDVQLRKPRENEDRALLARKNALLEMLSRRHEDHLAHAADIVEAYRERCDALERNLSGMERVLSLTQTERDVSKEEQSVSTSQWENAKGLMDESFEHWVSVWKGLSTKFSWDRESENGDGCVGGGVRARIKIAMQEDAESAQCDEAERREVAKGMGRYAASAFLVNRSISQSHRLIDALCNQIDAMRIEMDSLCRKLEDEETKCDHLTTRVHGLESELEANRKLVEMSVSESERRGGHIQQLQNELETLQSKIIQQERVIAQFRDKEASWDEMGEKVTKMDALEKDHRELEQQSNALQLQNEQLKAVCDKYFSVLKALQSAEEDKLQKDRVIRQLRSQIASAHRSR